MLDARIATADSAASNKRWSMWEWGATRAEATVGADGEPAGAALDEGGRYEVAVQYQWRLQFGQLELGGAARTARKFWVEGP